MDENLRIFIPLPRLLYLKPSLWCGVYVCVGGGRPNFVTAIGGLKARKKTSGGEKTRRYV